MHAATHNTLRSPATVETRLKDRLHSGGPDSRDVSPMSQPINLAVTQPTVTTGVASSAVPETSAPSLATEARPQFLEGLSGGPKLGVALSFDKDADCIKWESEHDEPTTVAHSNAGTIGHSPETLPTSSLTGKPNSSTKQQVPNMSKITNCPLNKKVDLAIP